MSWFRQILRASIQAIFVVSIVGPVDAQDSESVVSTPGFGPSEEKIVDGLFADFVGERPGASVLIAKGKEVIFSKSFGTANRESKLAVSSDSNFRIASVSKQFTAVAVLQLIDRKKLRLETTLGEVFPDFPAYGKEVTLFQMLTHQSGLPGYGPLANRTKGRQITDRDVLDYLKSLQRNQFKPGSRFEYSNSAYTILAEVVAATSGMSFDRYMKQHLFGPAGMNATGYNMGGHKVPNRAFGYRIAGDSIRLTDQSTSSALLGDGSIYTSTNDLLKWYHALDEGRLLSAALQKAAVEPQEGTGGKYGFGWFVEDTDVGRYIKHGGASTGFISYIMRLPEEKLSIILLTNRGVSQSNLPSINIDRRMRALLSLATAGRFPMPPAADKPPAKSLAQAMLEKTQSENFAAAEKMCVRLIESDDYYGNQREFVRASFALFQLGRPADSKKGFGLIKKLFPARDQSLAGRLFVTALEGKSVLDCFKTLRGLKGFYLSEDELQIAGQSFLQVGQNEDAINVFKCTVLAYPESWKAYDDLGRAYLADGKGALARQNYRKSVELNPKNKNAIEILKRLSADK